MLINITNSKTSKVVAKSLNKYKLMVYNEKLLVVIILCKTTEIKKTVILSYYYIFNF